MPHRLKQVLVDQVADQLTHAVASGAVSRRQQEGDDGAADDEAQAQHLVHVHPEKATNLISLELVACSVRKLFILRGHGGGLAVNILDYCTDDVSSILAGPLFFSLH